MAINRYTLASLSVAGGLISSLAWSSWCSGLILMVSFVPFFIIGEWIFENPGKYTRDAFLLYLLPGMFAFAMFTLGWTRAVSLTGSLIIITGLAFLMSAILWLSSLVRIKAGNIAGLVSLPVFWLSYEFLSLNVRLLTPWMNLGNGLAKDIELIQWYEITGTAGGSLWILLSNLFLTIFIVRIAEEEKKAWYYLIIWLLILFIPAGLSISRFKSIKASTQNPVEVVIIQPNTDPFTEKFTVPFDIQLRKVTELALKAATDRTSCIVTPETTVDDPVNLDSVDKNRYIQMIRQLTRRFPGVTVVAGMVSKKNYPGRIDPPTPSATATGPAGCYADYYNTAFCIDSGKMISYYHKSKLVPGIEMQFECGPGRLLRRILPYLGGTEHGYGIQEERSCFRCSPSGFIIGPVICYESVFGNYVSGYVKKGAEALFIITNDGWWNNTNGYRQHLWYASLRAIETRRPVVRAANTGISCIIDIRGKRISETQWWKETTLKGNIIPETRITPYVKSGDIILETSIFLSIIIIIAVFIIRPLKKKFAN
jgi:apolipoprotein N-acyltransferase